MNDRSTTSSDPLQPVALLGGRFRIEREVGRGGMATVYLAEDVRHGRRVALKILLPALAESLGADRFRREIAVIAALNHPNILPLYDSSDDSGGPPFFVMPYVEGETLRVRMARSRVPADEVVRIAIEVAEALDHAHRRGIVHRDVKPENILMLEGHAVVADFGIAHAIREAGGDRLTATGVLLGTPPYMSPEQVDGLRDIDGRSDLFSLGSVVYELLTGETPFAAPSVTGTLARVATAAPASPRKLRPEVSKELAQTVLDALAKDPDARPQTGTALASALRATPEAAWHPRRAPIGWRSLIVFGSAIAVAAAVFAATRRGVAVPERPSIAVLPFTTESAEASDAYVGSGIAEELLNALADVPNIRVASRTSSFALGANTSVAEIGRRLNVGSVLEGSVRRASGTIRVSARLIDTKRDAEVWSATMDGAAADVFQLQERIARAIVDKLRVRLAAAGAIVRRGTRDPEAYDLVLRAKALRVHGKDSLFRAAKYLENAIALDSSYAEAYADLTLVYEQIGILERGSEHPGGPGMTPGDAFRRARRAAERAIRLDGESAEAHLALAVLAFRYEWNWTGAANELREALKRNPTLVSAYLELSRVERSLGRFAHARQLLDSASFYSAGAEPSNGRLAYGRIAYFAHDCALAIQESLDSVATTTNALRLTWLAQAYLCANRLAPAEALLSSPRSAGDAGRPLTLATVLARTGRKDSALALIASARRGPVNDLPTHMAAAYLALGDSDRALAEIRRAVATVDPLVVDLAVDPLLDPIRSNVEFKAILSELRLPVVRR